MRGDACKDFFYRGVLFVAMCLLVLCGMAYRPAVVLAAPFGGGFSSAGVASAIGEVACHGEDELEDQFMIGLRDAYADAFNGSEKFSLHSPAPNPELMANVHRDAIVHGHYYNRGRSNAKLIRYANDVFGKNTGPQMRNTRLCAKRQGLPISCHLRWHTI